jgi:hypothetical protein
VGIAATAIFSFPLQTFACRNSLNLLFFEGKEFSSVRHYVWAIILVVLTYVIGNVVPKIGLELIDLTLKVLCLDLLVLVQVSL